MNPNELIEYFSNMFLHLCCVFLGKNLDWDFLKRNFESLVQISLHGESKSPDVPIYPTFRNHETLLIPDNLLSLLFLFILLFQYQFGCLLVIMLKLGNIEIKFLIRLPNLLPLSMIQI